MTARSGDSFDRAFAFGFTYKLEVMMNAQSRWLFSLVVPGLLLACAPEADHEDADTADGGLLTYGVLGGDTVRSYAQLDSEGNPTEIGITFASSFLEGLPEGKMPGNRCFDVDGDGTLDTATECLGEWGVDLAVPPELSRVDQNPFQWIGLGWNPAGHEPLGIYDLPHFDAHFYIAPREQVAAIRTGTCGYSESMGMNALFIDCEDSVTGVQPVPAMYAPPGHISVGVVVPDMGNHLINPGSPEFSGATFTHTFIYGSFGGHLTFFEPMFTKAFLESHPSECTDINQPSNWETTGLYPTRYCIRYHEDTDRYTVSIEGFQLREAAPTAM